MRTFQMLTDHEKFRKLASSYKSSHLTLITIYPLLSVKINWLSNKYSKYEKNFIIILL